MHPIVNEPIYKEFLETKTEMTKESYSRNLVLVRKFIGKEVHQATDKELIGYFLDCRSRGVRVTSQSTFKATLCSFFKHLAVHKIRVENPMLVVCEEIKTKNKDKTLRKALTQAQRDKVLSILDWEGGIHEYQLGLAYLFGTKVGLRRFEIAKIGWPDIDFDEETITVLGKGAKKATVPLSKMVIEKLKDYKMLVDKAGVDSRWVMFKRSDPSKHLAKSQIYNLYKKIKKRAGFGKDVLFSTHDGRRIFCTTLHEKGVNNLLAIKLSRHEDVKTFDGYVRKDDGKIKSELNRAID